MPNAAADLHSLGAFSFLPLVEQPPAGTAGPNLLDSATIPAGPAIQRFTPTGNRTGVIVALPSGPNFFAGPQMLVIINEHATNTITMAAVGTSNVANGTSCVISALACIILMFDDKTQTWFQVRAA